MIIQSQVLKKWVTFVCQTLSSCAAHWRPRRIWKLSKLFQLIRYWLKLVRLQYEIECDKLRSYCSQRKLLLDTCGPGKNGEAWCNPQFSTIETSLVTEYTTTSSMPSYKFLWYQIWLFLFGHKLHQGLPTLQQGWQLWGFVLVLANIILVNSVRWIIECFSDSWEKMQRRSVFVADKGMLIINEILVAELDDCCPPFATPKPQPSWHMS